MDELTSKQANKCVFEPFQYSSLPFNLTIRSFFASVRAQASVCGSNTLPFLIKYIVETSLGTPKKKQYWPFEILHTPLNLPTQTHTHTQIITTAEKLYYSHVISICLPFHSHPLLLLLLLLNE